MKCQYCGTELPDAATFCFNCGKSVVKEERTCSKCGSVLNDIAKFCMVCGTPVSAEAVEDDDRTVSIAPNIPRTTYTAPQPTYTAPQPTYTAPQPTYTAPQPTYTAPQPQPVPQPVPSAQNAEPQSTQPAPAVQVSGQAVTEPNVLLYKSKNMFEHVGFEKSDSMTLLKTLLKPNSAGPIELYSDHLYYKSIVPPLLKKTAEIYYKDIVSVEKTSSGTLIDNGALHFTMANGEHYCFNFSTKDRFNKVVSILNTQVPVFKK